jgi:predicted negative regulator of RcsB-dependent stress response
MPGMWWVVGVVAAVVLVASYVTWTATRVDRLHARAASATKALDAHLVRRAAAAAVLAEEITSPDLYAAARSALDAAPDDREAAENDLTRQLRSLNGPADEAALGAVVAASRRVALARQVHTDLVRDALAMRRRRLVRLLRLTRRHPSPAYFDVDEPTLDAPATVSGRS